MTEPEIIKRIDDEINKSIIEQIKEANPLIFDFNKWKNRGKKSDADFYKEIMEIADKIQKAIDERKASEQDSILVGSNGLLLQLYGNATEHDWLVWYVKEFKKGKL